jgi:predicted RNA-binding protein YlxR (DUF448 family)
MSSTHTPPEIGQADTTVSGPRRKCIITGQIANKVDLIRFVASPDGELVADTRNKLGGRGVWVSAARVILEQALSGTKLSGHLNQAVRISDHFLENLDRRLAEQLIARLSMMRKAGVLVTGGGKLRSQAMLKGLLVADDASPRETQQLISHCQPDWIEKDIPSVWLGQISGSTSVAYAGVLGLTSPSKRQLETLFRTELGRWRGVANA